MRRWVRTTAKTALLTAGFVALGTGVSFADGVETSGNGSVGSGNQAVLGLDAPINVSGNAIGAAGGVAGASSDGSSAAVVHGSDDGVTTSGDGSVLSGNQAVGHADVPINVTGNAVGGLLGTAGASSTDGSATVVHTSSEPDYWYYGSGNGGNGGSGGSGDGVTTSGDGSVLSGNQLVGHLDIPVNIAGNAVGVLGGVAGASAEDSSASVVHQSSDVHTSGDGSVLSGNQLVGHLDAPINFSGNSAAGLLGVAGASSEGNEATVVHGSGDGVTTSGDGAVLSGNQAVLDLDVPINASGNAIGAVGGIAGAAASDSSAAVIEEDSYSRDYYSHDSHGYDGEYGSGYAGYEVLPETQELFPLGDTVVREAEAAVETGQDAVGALGLLED